MQAGKRVELGKVGPEVGGGGLLLQAGKKFGAFQGKKERRKYDDYAADMVFHNKHLKAFNKCWLDPSIEPPWRWYYISLVSTVQNIIGICLWSIGYTLLKVIIEGKPPSFKGKAGRRKYDG